MSKGIGELPAFERFDDGIIEQFVGVGGEYPDIVAAAAVGDLILYDSPAIVVRCQQLFRVLRCWRI